MVIAKEERVPWTRLHDGTSPAKVPNATKYYPTSLEDLIVICRDKTPGTRIRAAGSHWALSDAAVSDDIFVETHDPNNRFPAMGRTLYEVVPGCLTGALIQALAQRHPDPYDDNLDHLHPNPFGGYVYPVHIETGKRTYRAYAEMDYGDDQNPRSLACLLRDHYGNSSYMGPWAFATLGGAGGQTVFGALATGTHGGDFDRPPLADSVLAIHLVADGGKHTGLSARKSASARSSRMTKS